MANSNRNKKRAAAIRGLNGCSAILGWLFLVALFALLAYSMFSGFLFSEPGTDVVSLVAALIFTLFLLFIPFAIVYGAVTGIWKLTKRKHPPKH